MTTHSGTFARCIAAIVVAAGIGAASSAHALTIVRDFTGGVQPTTIVGGGDIEILFNQAADWWEAAIADSHTVTISYQWSPLGSPKVGLHTLQNQAGGRETSGRIDFDNDGSTNWFLDPTPTLHDEWSSFVETTDDLGGGEVNTGRNYLGYIGPKIGASVPHDLLTVAVHEIGHALGMSSNNFSYQNESWPNNEVNVAVALLFDGSDIPTNNGGVPGNAGNSNAHLNGAILPNSLLGPNVQLGRRKLIDDASILANAQISGFTQVSVVPEPSAATLALAGFAALLLFGRRPRGRTRGTRVPALAHHAP